jgi:hypothetical protein
MDLDFSAAVREESLSLLSPPVLLEGGVGGLFNVQLAQYTIQDAIVAFDTTYNPQFLYIQETKNILGIPTLV